jgi:hypothetical protein
MEEAKIHRDYVQSLDYQLKHGSTNIKEYEQVNQLKLKVGRLDDQASQYYE